MHVVVCGGGISGMYCARALLRKGHHVTILEASERLGGRVMTSIVHVTAIECGAGRFASNNKHLLQLIHEYGLADKMIEISPKKTFIKDSKPTHLQSDIHITQLLDLPKSQLKGKTLEAVLHEQGMQPSLIEDIKAAYAYPHEFELADAHTALMTFKKYMNDDIRYYGLMGGLSQVIDALYNDLNSLGCKVITNAKVVEYKKGQIVYVDSTHGKLQRAACDNVFWCLTKNALLGIKGLEHDAKLTRSLNDLREVPLARVYAKFPPNKNGKVWFHGIRRTTTNNFIRHFIPINEQAGLVMASYTDGHFADGWKALAQDTSLLTHMLVTNLRSVFTRSVKDIPEPMWVHFCFSNPGVHVWAPNPLKYRNTQDTLGKYGYVVCGEYMAPYGQGWIEAALASAVTSLNVFFKAKGG